MSKKTFRLRIERNYETKEEAVKAAMRAVPRSQRVTVFEETSTSSGQCYERLLVWENGSERRRR